MNRNVRLVHEDAIKPDTLYARKPLEWFIGRAVKISFQSATSRVEHMWVLVINVEGHHLVGTLDNDPVLVDHIKYGDRVVLSRVQIEAVHLTVEEWVEEADQLRAKGDYFNRLLGYPSLENGLDGLYAQGLTPRQALMQWRNWTPNWE